MFISAITYFQLKITVLITSKKNRIEMTLQLRGDDNAYYVMMFKEMYAANLGIDLHECNIPLRPVGASLCL